jgi:ankyrin repeat protein
LHNPNKKNEHPEYLALIKHIVSVLPDSLEQKTSEGWTPLHLAVYIHREDVVSYLISIGANQRSRDRAGRNIAHSVLVSQNHSAARTKAKEIKKLLELFDKDALKEMLLERCNQAPGALTPLAYWMARNNGSYKKDKVVKVLTSYSSGEELEMINGEGDLPLHVVSPTIPSLSPQFITDEVIGHQAGS